MSVSRIPILLLAFFICLLVEPMDTSYVARNDWGSIRFCLPSNIQHLFTVPPISMCWFVFVHSVPSDHCCPRGQMATTLQQGVTIVLFYRELLRTITCSHLIRTYLELSIMRPTDFGDIILIDPFIALLQRQPARTYSTQRASPSSFGSDKLFNDAC